MSDKSCTLAVTCLVAVALMGSAADANAAKSKRAAASTGDSARSFVLERQARRHRPRTRIHLPVGPAYVYYDYPYYYSRGHYPTHIGGYVYYIPRSRNYAYGNARRSGGRR